MEEIRKKIALKTLELYRRANAGHIGSSLSCLEILISIFHQWRKPGDQVLLGKGHAAAALYAVLDSVGELGFDLNDFYKEGTVLGAHPPCGQPIPAIPFGTGSLGHGLPLACGLALDAKLKNISRRIFCILSDGDFNEGSTWEALHFAAQHRLAGLVIVADLNRLQGFGKTSDVFNFEPLEPKLSAMGYANCRVHEGHNFSKLNQGYRALIANAEVPKCLLVDTVKGYGLSFFQGKLESHYLPMTSQQYQLAVKETLGLCEDKSLEPDPVHL